MKIQFPVLLFDFEGTLVDFQWKLKDAARDIKNELRLMGFDPSDWEDDYAALRNNAIETFRVSQTLKVFGLDKREALERLNPIYERYDQDAATHWSVFPNVIAVLSRLKNERQIKLGLVSNVGRRTIDEVLPRLGLDSLFDIVLTRNDVEMLKPNGEGIRTALAKLGAANSDVLYIGDSVTDVRGAKDAGVKVAIIQGGESAPASLVAAAPDHLWNAIAEIEALYNGGEQVG